MNGSPARISRRHVGVGDESYPASDNNGAVAGRMSLKLINGPGVGRFTYSLSILQLPKIAGGIVRRVCKGFEISYR